MDKEKKKRQRLYRLIITETLMFVAVIVTVIILLFVAMGYKFGSDGSLNQTGLLQVDSTPTGAVVAIDGEELFAHTNTSKMLSEGEHTVRLTKDGYELWEKTVEISAGVLYKLDYPRLFKQDRTAEVVEEFDERPGFLVASPKRTSLLYAGTGSTTWNLMSIRGDDATVTEIDVAPYFRVTEETEAPEIAGEIARIEWNENGDKVLVEWKNGETHDFILINVRNPESSLNLTEVFGLEFTDVKLANDSAERLLALESGNLRKISVPSQEISSVLVSGIESFNNLEMEVVYVTVPDEKGERAVGLYREGEKSVVILTTFTEEKMLKTAVSEYLGEKYISIVADRTLLVRKGEYPVVDRSFGEMTEVARRSLDEVPDEFYVHDKGRFLVAKKGTKIAVLDAELGKVNEFTLENARMNWLDEFLLANIADGKLVARDFDGTNRRILADASTGYDSVIAANNKWLYYMADHGTKLKRERL